MKKYRLEPLSDFERRQAEANHGLVYKFLHKYGYSIEDAYSVAIFGYLKGIQIYNRREDLQKQYRLSVICYRCMKSELGNSYRMEQSQKRKPMEELLSLDAEYFDMENLYNSVSGKSLEVEYMETESFNQVMGKMTDKQRKIVELKMDGYSNNEICLMMEIPSSTFYKEINRIKVILES